jgi:acyl-coenzyme A synthetase/AMP-(fatty) acid ligase
MMPRNIHFIDVMPLNASGKIDRNKLKAQFTHGNKD